MYTYQFIEPNTRFQFIESPQLLSLHAAMSLLFVENPIYVDFYKVTEVYILTSTVPGSYDVVKIYKFTPGEYLGNEIQN